jgi:hypothetical protein
MLLFISVCSGTAIPPDINNDLQHRYPGKEKLQHYLQDSQFQYEQIQIEEFSLLRNVLIWLAQHLIDLFSFEGSGHIFSGIVITGFILSILYIILQMVLLEKPTIFLKNRTIRRKQPGENAIRDTDEDINVLIIEARKMSDYRRVIYLIFLKILNQLQQKNIIQIGQAKTNRDYLSELTRHRLAEKFREVITVHECIRYGNYLAEDKTMLELISLMDQFFRDLKGEK